jgi:hypothetical protein
MPSATSRASSTERNSPSEPWNDGNAEALDGRLGGDLVAHHIDMFGLRANERHIVGGQNFRKLGVFRQEAVARMHRIGARDLAGGQDLRNVEIAFAGIRRANTHAFVRQAHMHGVCIGSGMHRDRTDAQFFASAHHAQGDLTTVGDQNFLEHV